MRRGAGLGWTYLLQAGTTSFPNQSPEGSCQYWASGSLVYYQTVNLNYQVGDTMYVNITYNPCTDTASLYMEDVTQSTNTTCDTSNNVSNSVEAGPLWMNECGGISGPGASCPYLPAYESSYTDSATGQLYQATWPWSDCYGWLANGTPYSAGATSPIVTNMVVSGTTLAQPVGLNSSEWGDHWLASS